MTKMPKRLALLAVIALAAFSLTACEPRDLPSVLRMDDPVVLTGADVPQLIGAPPGRVVAFRFVYGLWQQIPVQVDERAVVDFGTIKHQSAIGITTTVYTDPTTWVGADPDPNVDANDEIAFMAHDVWGQAHSIDDNQLGVHYTLGEPAHVVPGSGVQVTLHDPLVPNSSAWVYLFRSDGSLDPGAGHQYVDYRFNLLSGNYKTTYHISSGANPENSTITTPNYSDHFADRWIMDTLAVTRGGAAGVDVLDRNKSGFVGTCTRTEDTFSTGGGAFIANKSGPVRAIRSYLGANSGTWTQRDHIMYDARQVITTYLRVHIIPPLRDWMDYNATAAGMTYYDSNTLGGVPVDGAPDAVATSPLPTWEMLKGPQGAIVNTGRLDTSISFGAGTLVHYYSDDTTPTETQCTGDSTEYGASGATINAIVPCTDPAMGCTDTLRESRTISYLAPSTTTADAAKIADQQAGPITTSVSAFTP